MQLSAVLILGTCLQVVASGHAQNITFSGHDVSLGLVFKEIKKQTNFKAVYDKDFIENKTATLDAKNLPLKEFLNHILEPLSMDYVIRDKTIFIRSRAVRINSHLEIEPPPINVRGRIVNEKGEPVVASLIIKGSKRGTTSDVNGFFELLNVDATSILIITGVGIEPLEVTAKTNLSVIVKMSNSPLDEVVFKGYYSEKRSANTGNVSKVKAETIEKQPVANPIAALQGRVPGLQITQNTGVPGGSFTVRIRGQNSIANGNDPLYIVDGVPFINTTLSFNTTSGEIYADGRGASPLNSINPADIESIEILKDADATSIYGSRGANGVILITTKRGKAGDTKVDLNVYSGIGKITRKAELLNTQQYVAMRKEAFMNDNIDPTAANAPDLITWDTTRYTDWQDVMIGGTAQITDAQLSITGGEGNTQFSAGGGYHRETTVFPGDNSDQRISTHLGIFNTSPNQKFRTNLSVSYSANITNLPRQDITFNAAIIPPNAPALYKDDGDLNWEGWTFDMPNPLSYTRKKYEGKTNTLIANAVISYMLLPGLEIKSSVGYTNTSQKAITTTPISAYNPVYTFFEHSSAFSTGSFQNWLIEPQVSYTTQLGSGKLNVLAGATFQDQREEGNSQFATGFASEALMKNINSASMVYPSTSRYGQYRYNAFFGRLNYSYNEKYIVNLTGRRDGSSRFGPGRQFANFGAVGAAWLFSKENFMRRISFLSFGKLRGSYGITGNDQLGDYQYLDVYTSSGPYLGTVGLTPVRLNNPDFAWETNKKLEAGLEVGFLRDQLVLELSYYRNRSSNQLVGFPLPPTTGFESVQSNFPATVQNKGWEVELTTTNIQRHGMRWTTSLNVTIPQNKLVAFPNLEAFPAYNYRLVVGEPLGIRKLYHSTGINQTTGTYKFEDVDGNGVLNTNDRQTVRFIGQDFYGGLLNTFQYKGFQVEVMFQFIKQLGNNYTISNGAAPGSPFNQFLAVLERWQKPGDEADIQKFSTSSDAQSQYTRLTGSDGSVGDASFIRLKNLSVSYELPGSWISKLRMEKVQFFIRGQNLLTITNYKGLDPENQYTMMPPLRVLTGGIHLTF